MEPNPHFEVTRAEAGPGHAPAPVLRVHGGQCGAATAELAVELPVAFQYNGISHAVMLATPSDLEDFALGFSLSEGIVDGPADLYGVDIEAGGAGITLAIDVAGPAFARLKERRRTLAGRTGCGICGTESLDQVLRPLHVLVTPGPSVAAAALARAFFQLANVQALQRDTGATHGAAWCSDEGQILCAREDVGRHNALDKLIGALARARADLSGGFALITSRASVEMVQKSATAGIAILAAVSAPTALAVRVAEDCGQTLIGFVRGESFNVYTHPERMVLQR